ncbi:MAG TPA: aldo/keto reductase [Nitrospiraceae bacterium]|nr:aldo/keto reductase [Nitrospiraceae bacterium]
MDWAFREVVGRALKERSDRPYVFTKCTLLWDSKRTIRHTMKASSITRELEDSLRRLQVDVIDLYQIHWPDPDAEIEEGWSTLAALKREGKIRYIGVSNFNVEQMARAQAIAPIDSLQPPYSILRPEVEEKILPFCRRHAIGVIVYSPMESGLLTGKMTRERIAAFPADDWRRGHAEFRDPRLSRNLELVEKLRTIGQRHDRSPAEVAIAWTLRHPAVTGAIVGARRPEQVDELIGASDFRLSETDIREIDSCVSRHPSR